MRWVVAFLTAVLAAGTGLLLGYVRWGRETVHTERVEARLETTKSEAATLRTENEQLAQRVEQLTKEQERLAQENEILRKQQTTDRLLGGTGGALPERPPK